MQLLNELLRKDEDNKEPFAIAKIESSLSIRQSIETGVQLRKMGEKFGFEETLKLLTRLIENTASFFNVTNNLSGTQLVQIAQAIVERFGYDNIEDIILALKDARMGLCEKVYGRIDGEVILGWIERYMERKAEELEKIHQNIKKATSEISPEVLNLAKQIISSGVEIKRTQQSVVDERIWLSWFNENKESMTLKQLKNIKADLETNNIFRDGIYEDTISWINEHIANASSH